MTICDRLIDSALAEVRRILKKGGLFFCATSGENGMTRFLYDVLDEIGIPYSHEFAISFTLQNGMQMLKKQFENVGRRDYFSSKKVNGYLHIPKEYGMFVAPQRVEHNNSPVWNCRGKSNTVFGG